MEYVLSRFVCFLQGRGHSLKLANLTLQNVPDLSASLNGTVIKYGATDLEHLTKP